MTTVMVSGKFDLVHEGHVAHLMQAYHMGDHLYIVTHSDEVVAKCSKSKICAVPLWSRVFILRSILGMLGGKGEVVVSDNKEGLSTDELLRLRPDIFAKGGDRTSTNMPAEEIEACKKICCRIVYGVGKQLNESSELKKLLL